jgi:TetR/AcrR family tetracycline transcriptional repressor
MAVSRDEVVATAIRLLEEVGLQGLTLRRLAAELGISAPTLYWHVRDKRDLLDQMAEAMAVEGRERSPLRSDMDWLDKMAAIMRRRYHALISHRDGALVVAGNRPTKARIPRIEQFLRVWTQQGFPPAEALSSILALGNYVLGSALEYQAEADRARSDTPAESPLPADEYPLLAAVAGRRGDRHADFEQGLALMIAGLKARRAELQAESGAGSGPETIRAAKA